MKLIKYIKPYLNAKSKPTYIMEKSNKKPKITELRNLAKVKGLTGYSQTKSKLPEL